MEKGVKEGEGAATYILSKGVTAVGKTRTM